MFETLTKHPFIIIVIIEQYYLFLSKETKLLLFNLTRAIISFLIQINKRVALRSRTFSGVRYSQSTQANLIPILKHVANPRLLSFRRSAKRGTLEALVFGNSELSSDWAQLTEITICPICTRFGRNCRQ